MSCNKEKEVLLCLIDMYKDLPYLWKKYHQNYRNQGMRDEGLNKLLEIYKSFDENATVKTIKTKIKNMRTGYARELKKIKDSGEGAAVYVPMLWYFDAISFLSRRSESCLTVQYDSLQNGNVSSDDGPTSVWKSNGGRQKRKKLDTFLEKQQNIVLAEEKHMPIKDEEWKVYGLSIGFQMKDLNKRQLMISQKIISDIMFYAKLDQLSEYSCVVVRPPDESIPNSSGSDHYQNQFFSSSSASHQTELPHHSSPLYTLRPLHTQSVRQPLPSPHQPLQSPQQQTQLSRSSSPDQPSPSAQVQVEVVHKPLQSPQNQTQLSNLSTHQLSRSDEQTSKGQVTIRNHLPSSDTQAYYLLDLQAPSRHPSPPAPAQAQPSRQSQEVTSDGAITVVNIEQLLDYFPNENVSNANSLSMPIIDDSAEAMEEFLNFKRRV